jgi:hypothetical protein
VYYSELVRIRKTQRLLEKIAYISVGADFMIAISTYLVLSDVRYSSSALMASDYIDLALVVIATVMFAMLAVMKFQKRLSNRAKYIAFRLTH